METRHAVLALVLLVTGLMALRGLVALRAGEFGTLARQSGVGAVVLAFGVALYRRWDRLG